MIQSNTHHSKVTTTHTENGSAHLVLHLKDSAATQSAEPIPPPKVKLSAGQKVEKLVKKTTMTIASLPEEYQAEVFQQVQQWAASFFNDYKVESHEDAEIEKAAHALLFLDVYIENVMDYYALQSDPEQSKWLLINNKIKKIVASILPKNIDLDMFIETDRKKQLEIQLRYKISLEIKDMMVVINALFDELEEQLYESADTLLEQLQTSFHRLKADLIDLDQYQKIEIENLHTYLDTLTDSISGIYQDLQCQLKETEELGEEIRGADAVLNNLRDGLESILNKI